MTSSRGEEGTKMGNGGTMGVMGFWNAGSILILDLVDG